MEELASRNAAVATNDPLYAAIAKLTPQQKQIVMAFVAGLNVNPNMPFWANLRGVLAHFIPDVNLSLPRIKSAPAKFNSE